MKTRQLIPDDQVIVILDTSPVRDLAFAASPAPWVGTFTEMSKAGYTFCLSDSTAAELLNQVRTGRTPLQAHKQAINWVSAFLNPEVRVLPGHVDLEGMIGLHEDWDINETRFLAQVAWQKLLDPLKPDEAGRPSFKQLLEEERQEWMSDFKKLQHASRTYGLDVPKSDPGAVSTFLLESLADRYDEASGIKPPPSIRRHLEFRYRIRQYLRTERKKEPYNPATKNNRNDGIDVYLYSYFMLPALVVANDGGFYEKLDDISSFQKAWFVRPEQLASDWLAGKHPQPEWPEIVDEEEDDEDIEV